MKLINWNFLKGWQEGGGGVKTIKPFMGGVWIFSGTTHCKGMESDNNIYM